MCYAFYFALCTVLAAQDLTPSPKHIEDLIADAKYAQAEVEARAWLTIAEKTSGRESLEVAGALDLLSQAVRTNGKSDAAPAEEALAIKERLLPPGDPRIAHTLHELGTVLVLAGEYTRARELHERALKIHSDAFGPASRQVMEGSLGLISLYYDIGDYEAALPLCEKVLALREVTYGPRSEPAAQSLSDLGIMLWKLKRYKEARPLLERALSIREEKNGPDSPWVAASLNNLSLVLDATGAQIESLPLLQRAMIIREKRLGPDHPRVAIGISNLASCLSALHRYEEALPLRERALAITEKAMGAWHPDTATRLRELTETRAYLGDFAGALEADLRSVEIRREHVRWTVRGMSERQALLYYASDYHLPLDYLLSLASGPGKDLPHVTEKAWDALIRSRALVFDEMAARQRTVDASSSAEVASLAQALADARSRLSKLVVEGPGKRPAGEYAAAFDAARQSKEIAERDMGMKSSAFREELLESHLGLDAARKALPAGAGLVALAAYEHFPFQRERYEKSVRQYVAFVLNGENVSLVSLGPALAIDAAVAKWHEQISRQADSPGIADRRNEASYRAAGESLRRLIWDPVMPRLAGIQRVFIVPDGAIHLVDFAALPVVKNRYLAETGPTAHYLSTERDLAVPAASQHGTGLLAMGDPDFNLAQKQVASSAIRRRDAKPLNSPRRTRGCMDLPTLQFDPLPASGIEVREIASAWNLAQHASDNSITGTRATETLFKQAAPGKRVVHLATHGFFLGGECKAPHPIAHSPLLRAGLAFAGANTHETTKAEDGIVTAEEIAAMNLQGVDWAVLSGCDTGAGEVTTGEGVFGLRRAFQVSGVRTVIMSLWSVDDESARLWMRGLYERRFRDGSDVPTAVRDASLRLLRDRRAKGRSTHPFYWAGFIAAGDWR